MGIDGTFGGCKPMQPETMPPPTTHTAGLQQGKMMETFWESSRHELDRCATGLSAVSKFPGVPILLHRSRPPACSFPEQACGAPLAPPNVPEQAPGLQLSAGLAIPVGLVFREMCSSGQVRAFGPAPQQHQIFSRCGPSALPHSSTKIPQPKGTHETQGCVA